MGIARQTLSEWKRLPAFVAAVNCERNKRVEEAGRLYREQIIAMVGAAINAVGKSIAAGDTQSARWFLERVPFAAAAAVLFDGQINPHKAPEDIDGVLREMAAARVDEFLTGKGATASERMRVMAQMVEREYQFLKNTLEGDELGKRSIGGED